MDFIAEQEHLCNVHLVDVSRVGDDDGRLGAAAPPRVVVHHVVLQRHVVPPVDTDAAEGAVVRRDVVDVDVAAAPDGDGPAGEPNMMHITL